MGFSLSRNHEHVGNSRQKNAEHEQFENEKEMLSLKSSVGECVISDPYRYTPTR